MFVLVKLYNISLHNIAVHCQPVSFSSNLKQMDQDCVQICVMLRKICTGSNAVLRYLTE